jgi:uncharacterized protein involved in exopolysaccharide biosynthesis
LQELSTQFMEAQAQSYEIQSNKEQVERFTAGAGNSGLIPDVLSNPMVLHLKQQISEQQAKLNNLSGQIGYNHPNYKRAVAELASLQERLQQEIRTISSSVGASVQAAEQRKNSLTSAINTQKKKLLELREKRDRLEVLKSRVTNAQQAYDGALQRISQARMESHNTLSNVSLVNAAVAPPRPSGPDSGRNVIIGLMAGLAIGVGLALWGEVKERRVRSRDDLRLALGVPVLAVIDHHGSRDTRRHTRNLVPRDARLTIR